MDALSIIADWKRRLIAMAENPPYVFRDTPQHLIDAHRRQLTSFVGFSESAIGDTEARLGVRFPLVFRTYLGAMAESPGDLFRGSDLPAIEQFDEFKADALDLMAETDRALTLPPEAIVYLFHQGYTFSYVLATGGFDGPAMQWTEAEPEPRQVAETFAEMVGAELCAMERNHATAHEEGGYYMTLYPDGGTSMEFPEAWDRPLERQPKGGEWRPFSF